MEYVSLQEGAQLTGKSEMTIRRLTKKPGGKPNTRIDDGKIYIVKDWLLKHYPPVTPRVTPEPEPVQTDYTEPIQPPKQPIQTDYTALIQELKADKEYLQKQLDTERAQYHERQRESNIIIQTMQKQLPASIQDQPQRLAPSQPNWLTLVIVVLLVALLVIVSWMYYQQSTTQQAKKEPPTERTEGVFPRRNVMLNTDSVTTDSTIQK